MMANGSWHSGGVWRRDEWKNQGLRDAFTGASVLLVDDDADVSEMLMTMLELAGFRPTVCSSAEAALERLREGEFDLVLTDYMLPRRTGGWLLQQARAEGLIDATPVLVLTAHPQPHDVGDYEVISKPFDLDQLVSRVQQQLGGPTRRPKMPFSAAPNGDGIGNGGHDVAPVELILYVRSSPRCLRAIETIKSVVSRLADDRVSLTIHNLSTDPSQGVEDLISFTPTLVRRLPRPRTYLLGDITNRDIVEELLQGTDAERAGR